MISKSVAIDVLNVALSTGGDFAEIYIEEKNSSNIVVENGKVETAGSSLSFGAGIRILNKFQSVYGYTNDVSKKGLLALADSLSKSYKGKRIIEVNSIKKVHVKNISKLEQPLSEITKDEKINLLKRGDKILREYDKRIVRTQVGISSYKQETTIFNSKGNEFCDSKERGRMFLIAIASENGQIETFFAGPGASKGFEFFTKDIDIEKMAKDVASKAILMLGAKECPSGKMPVVIGNGFGGVLFHEACGHSLEGTSVSKKISVFSNSLGKQIASNVVTAIDDGTIPNGWGSNNIDDEGNKTAKNILIKDGICTSFLLDDFTGRRIGLPGNGACRRQSYKYEPTSRMSNTYIAGGKSTREEIIKSVKLGLYAASLGGGQVDPATGEFNFACEEAYIIRDGKVCEPVKGAMLIGKGSEVLLHIDMVGNDVQRAQGMCGSASGSIPVDVGQPTIRVSEITVGGRGGELK